jgi:hypothetical protein
MDPSIFALIGTVILIVFLLAIIGALVYIPLTFANKMLRGLIRQFRNTASLIRTPTSK